MAEIKSPPAALASIDGKRVISKFGTLTPAFFGTTIVELHKDRLIEYTSGPIASRECHFLASDIDSVEIVTTGNPLWLVLGIATIAIFGLGLLFILLYFVFKHRFFVICSGNNVMATGLKGNAEDYRTFMYNVTKVASHYKLKRS